MSKKFIYLPYILFLLWAFLVPLVSRGASDCSTINLITQEDSPFAKIPVYNQERVNICYAYSASQMVDYHLIKNGFSNSVRTHPAWVALNYARKRERSRIEIGHTIDALEAIREAALCDYSSVSLALKSWAQNEEDSEAKILSQIELSTATPPVQVLSSLLESACESRTHVKLPTPKKYNFRQLPTTEHFRTTLEGKIAELEAPISIAYCSNIWRNPEYQGIGLTQRLVRDSLKKDCHYHESLVVGRKEIAGSCHLLVRNTWGSHWTKSNQNWKCVCRNKQTGEAVDDCSPETHPGEDFSVEACWLPSENLAANTGVVTTLEPEVLKTALQSSR